MTTPELVSRHEAGHSTIAAAVGWQPGEVTVESGAALAGCARYRYPLLTSPPPSLELPFVAWPPDWRDWYEKAALITVAGELAVLLLTPLAPGRQPEPVTEEAARLVECGEVAEDAARLAAEHPVTEEQRVSLRQVVDDPAQQTDAAYLAWLAWVTHGDPWAAAAWLAWIDVQARALVLRNADRIERLAALLAEAGSLSGEAVAAVLREPPRW